MAALGRPDSPERSCCTSGSGRSLGGHEGDDDADADHATPRLIGAISPRARACSSDRLISSGVSARPRLRSAATISCSSVVNMARLPVSS